MKEKDLKLYDSRIVDRYIEKGILKAAEYKEYLKNLPDDTASGQFVQLDLHDTELGDGSPDSDSAEGT